MISSLEPLKNW